MKKNRKPYFYIGAFLCGILAIGSFSTATLAWIVNNTAIEEIKVDASSLNLSVTNQSIYKYVFPAYKNSAGQDTDIIDYLSTGEAKAVSSANSMNSLDPAYLTIQDTISQEGISGLNSNIVLAFSFEVTYTTSTNIYMYADRIYDSFVPSKKGAQRISDFLHFDVFSSEEVEPLLDDALVQKQFTADGNKTAFEVESLPSGIASVTIDGVETSAYTASGKTITFNSAPASNAKIVINYSTLWHSVKKLAEEKSLEEHSKFGLHENRLNIIDTVLEEDRPSSEATTTYTYYLNIDYDYALASSDDVFNFFAAKNLGDSFSLDKDYSISFGVKQGAK